MVFSMRMMSAMGSASVFLFFFLFSLQLVASMPVEEEEEPSHEVQDNCVHQYPTLDDEMPFHVKLDGGSRRTKRSPEHQLRIKVFYHSSVDALPSKKRRVVKRQVVPGAVRYWERVLKVRRNDAVVRLHRKCKNNQYFVAEDDPTQYCKEECVETR